MYEDFRITDQYNLSRDNSYTLAKCMRSYISLFEAYSNIVSIHYLYTSLIFSQILSIPSSALFITSRTTFNCTISPMLASTPHFTQDLAKKSLGLIKRLSGILYATYKLYNNLAQELVSFSHSTKRMCLLSHT